VDPLLDESEYQKVLLDQDDAIVLLPRTAYVGDWPW